ncbi:MAG: Kazal-type serine protease inhibitor family protein [Myxococcota bacterium]
MMLELWIAMAANAKPACYCDNFWAKPVCGADGVTYEGDCEAKCAEVEIVFDGPCPTVDIPSSIAVVSQCTHLASLFALPAENGHVYAAPVVNHEIDPFRVETVTYSLVNAAGDPGCTGTTPHRLDLWVQSTTTPDASPVLEYSAVQTPSPAAGAANSTYTVDVPDFELEPQARLFIGIQMVAAGSDKLCVTTCDDKQPPPGTSYWSNAAAPPYPWADLLDFGLNNVPVFSVSGQIVEGGRYGGGSEM